LSADAAPAASATESGVVNLAGLVQGIVVTAVVAAAMGGTSLLVTAHTGAGRSGVRG
jgi:hypothetical protein